MSGYRGAYGFVHKPFINLRWNFLELLLARQRISWRERWCLGREWSWEPSVYRSRTLHWCLRLAGAISTDTALTKWGDPIAIQLFLVSCSVQKMIHNIARITIAHLISDNNIIIIICLFRKHLVWLDEGFVDVHASAKPYSKLSGFKL